MAELCGEPSHGGRHVAIPARSRLLSEAGERCSRRDLFSHERMRQWRLFPPGPWCGGKDSHWWLYDSRHDYSNEISLEKSAQRRILQKFAHAYALVVDNRQAFPKPAGPSSTLAALVGYGGAAGTCVGSFVWNAVPLDCTDLFSVWGTPRVYNYLTEDYIALFTSSTIKDASGNRVPVASQLDARTRLFAQ